MDSLTLLLGFVQRERELQLTHFDSLDSKAGVLLGFAATEIALAPDVGQLARTLGLLTLVVSAGLAVLAFSPRRLPTVDVQHLRAYLRADERITSLTVHDTLIEMVREASGSLRRKAFYVRWSMGLLALASLILASGLAFGGAHA